MLDTYGRKYVNPIIDGFAKILLKYRCTSNFITMVSLILGLMSAFLIYLDINILGVVILWLSGFSDSVDGAMTIFLTVGALSHNKGIKSFTYQAGIMERTEGFIFLSGMVIFTKIMNEISLFFTIAIVITAAQRMLEEKKY